MTDLTIREVRTTLLRMPWADDPWLAGHALGPMRDLVVVEVVTQSGITGMGYLHLLNLPLQRTIGACIAEAMAPRIIGRDASAVEAIWRDLWRVTLTGGRGGVAMMAQSAIDIALWDVLGKAAGMPLHRLWGHCRSEIPIYGSGCFRGSLGEGMVAKAKHYVSQGYKAIKMQVAIVGDWRTDVANVRAMRDAVGPDVEIMIDVNMGWTADQAIHAGRRFEECDIYWLEEPVTADDYAGYLRCAEALDMRVVGGETHFGRADLKPFLENPRLPILQPDPMRGGFTELRKIATVADTWGMTIAPHLFPELNVHLLASIPNGIWAEQMGLLDDAFVSLPKIENGMITAPETPGHGLAFRPEVLRDFVLR
ncbi:MAG TPA: mandelate racemase/muconate lactonizing enzyme family protein [Roseomonas sp.]|nr:mandelate racemase/muconate lactonizing enzyme family protein [Roseomonas sp.]